MKAIVPKRVSQQQIAQAAGVAPPVVSVVLSGRRSSIGVSEATRQRVLRIAEQMGYPQRQAPRTRTRTIVWLGDPHSAPRANANWLSLTSTTYFQRLLNSVIECLDEHQYVLTIKQWREPHRIVDWLTQSGAEGVIWFAFQPADQQHLPAIAQALPTVVINQPTQANVDRVDIDQEENIRLAAEHLWNQGHRRIAYYGSSNPTALRRQARYKLFMAEHDQPVVREFLDLSDDMSLDPFSKAARLLDTWAGMKEKRPTALIVGDIFALPLLLEAERRQVQIPADLSLVGIDNYGAGEVSRPALTSVDQPLGELGRTAIEMLLRRIADPSRPTHATEIRPSLVVRQSVATIPV